MQAEARALGPVLLLDRVDYTNMGTYFYVLYWDPKAKDYDERWVHASLINV